MKYSESVIGAKGGHKWQICLVIFDREWRAGSGAGRKRLRAARRRAQEIWTLASPALRHCSRDSFISQVIFVVSEVNREIAETVLIGQSFILNGVSMQHW